MIKNNCKRYEVYSKENNRFLLCAFTINEVANELGISRYAVKNLIDGINSVYDDKYIIIPHY
jgi:biotin operon repressor